MTEPRIRPAGVFWGRVEWQDNAFRARCGVRDAGDAAPEPAPSDTNAFANYDDARSWVHLSAAQAGFRSIAWDVDTCAAPEACAAD